jgi:SAM-dependent methyltransferase
VNRLAFRLPEFTRVAWVSQATRERWSPRLTAVVRAFAEAEWRAVLSGTRRCALGFVQPHDLPARAAELARHGLSVVPVSTERASRQPYTAAATPAVAGQPFVFRVVVGRIEDAADFAEAWRRNDEEDVGRLLGYPACCRAFFQRVWRAEGFRDTTWPMALNGGRAGDTRQIDVRCVPEANILWRWVGVRAVPHLPCSFECAETTRFGAALLDVGTQLGFVDEMQCLREMLTWPVEWTALHGIAEIKTPILRIAAMTDATADRYTVRYLGDGYPERGVRGLRFPQQPPVPLVQIHPAWYHRDNGFVSRDAMGRAHQRITTTVRGCLGAAGGDVVDLGCGNGALLARIADLCRGVRPFGIDCDAARIDHARKLMPAFANNFVVGDISGSGAAWGTEPRFAVALQMPGRLLELPSHAFAAVRTFLRNRCDAVVAYAYGDWLERAGGFAGLAARTGLEFASHEDDGAVAVGVVARIEERAQHALDETT